MSNVLWEAGFFVSTSEVRGERAKWVEASCWWKIGLDKATP